MVDSKCAGECRQQGAIRPPVEALISRRGFLKGLAAASIGGSGILLQGCGGEPPKPGGMDALQSKVLSELAQFTDWLQREDVPGYIGEMNWPNDLERNFGDAAEWNALGEMWFKEADRHDLWVTGWNANDRGIGSSAYFYIYGAAGGSVPRILTTRYAQADVYEAHQTTPNYKRGVNLPSGYANYGATGFSNENPSVYGEDYHYMGQKSLDYLATRGVTLVRFTFRWERLQRTLGGPLDEIEMQRIRDFVDRAASAGLDVILDVHNFGSYYLYDTDTGTVAERKIGTLYDGRVYVTQAHLENLWARLSAEFQDEPTVIAYDIMNEPKDLAPTKDKDPQAVWEEISQNVLDVIRAQEGAGAHKLVLIPGYQTSAVRDWVAYHPNKWITDSANNYRYEAHHYFGEYDEYSYSDLLATAQEEQQGG
jgi:hypothetical protein